MGKSVQVPERDQGQPSADRWTLYRHAVQQPDAEVSFVCKAYEHHHAGTWPTLLREDFAGSAAVAATWVSQDEERRALAVELDQDTAEFAQGQLEVMLGPRADDVILLNENVMAITSPRCEVTLATNFSLCEFHDREALLAYFRLARRSLRPGGLLIADGYTGPTAHVPLVDKQTIDAIDDLGQPLRFDYLWEQRSFDRLTHRTKCHIHFASPPRTRQTNVWKIRDAFVYDWRWWSPVELMEAASQAGFTDVAIWCDVASEPGYYRPVETLDGGRDVVFYLVAKR